MKKNGTKRVIHVTDLHINCPKISTEDLVNQYISLLTGLKDKDTIDYLIDTGDFFDGPVIFDTNNGKLITKLMTFVLTFCFKWKIKFISLKGTDSHDGKQPEHWGYIRDGLIDKPEFIYADKIGLYYEDDFTILTVPDNASSSPVKTESIVKSLLKSAGIDKVELALTHSMYKHHVETLGVKIEAHDSEYYSSIVKWLVLNGHIHTRSLFKRISTGGSLTRNRQGEEEPKGIHDITIDTTTGKSSITFIENKNAFIFKTLLLETLEVESALDAVMSFVKLNKMFDTNSYLRLKYNEGLSVTSLRTALREEYPLLTVDVDKIGKVDKKSLEEELAAIEMIETPLVPDTLVELVKEDMLEQDVVWTELHETILNSIVSTVLKENK